MSNDRISIAVVGGGRTGTPLIENLIEIPYIDLVGIADVDPECPTSEIACRYDVPFTQDALTFAEQHDLDVIIEVSGDPQLKPAMKAAFVLHDNKHTILLHDLVARLVLSIATGRNELVETHHPQDDGVG